MREKITFCIHMCTYIYDCVLGVVLAVDILRLKGRECLGRDQSQCFRCWGMGITSMYFPPCVGGDWA